MKKKSFNRFLFKKKEPKTRFYYKITLRYAANNSDYETYYETDCAESDDAIREFESKLEYLTGRHSQKELIWTEWEPVLEKEQVYSKIFTPGYAEQLEANGFYIGLLLEKGTYGILFYSNESKRVEELYQARIIDKLWGAGFAVYGNYTIDHPYIGLHLKSDKSDALIESAKRNNIVDMATANTKVATQMLRTATNLPWEYVGEFVPELLQGNAMKEPKTLVWRVELRDEPQPCEMLLNYYTNFDNLGAHLYMTVKEMQNGRIG